MGFMKDLSEVVVRQQEKKDVDLVLAFFRYIETLADDDIVDIFLPKEIYLNLLSIKQKYGIESFERSYWQTSLIFHQFINDEMPVPWRKELVRRAKISYLLNAFEVQVALLWCEDWEKIIDRDEISLELSRPN